MGAVIPHAPPRGYSRRQSGLYVRKEWPEYRSRFRYAGEGVFDPAIRLRDKVVWPYLYPGSGLNPSTGDWIARLGGIDLALQAGSPTYDVRSPFCAGVGDDVGVGGDGTAYWKAAGGPTTGAKDLFLLAALLWGGSTTTRVYAGTRPSAGGAGWSTYSTFGIPNGVGLWLGDGSQSVNPSTPASMVAGQVTVVGFAVNVSETGTYCAYGFANGAAGTGVAPSGALGSITDTAALALGAYTDGSNPISSADTLLITALWLEEDLFSAGAAGAAEMLALAQRFTRQLSGTWPQLARRGQEAPTDTRATEGGHAVLRDGVRRYWHLGPGLAVVDDQGLLIEGSAQTRIHNSRDLSSWPTKVALDATGGIAGAPNGLPEWTRIVEDATPGTYHYITSNTNGAPYTSQFLCCSWLMKRGGSNNRRYLSVNMAEMGAYAQCGGTVDLDASPGPAILNVGTSDPAKWAVPGYFDEIPQGDGISLCWFAAELQITQTVYALLAWRTSGGAWTWGDSFDGNPTTYPDGALVWGFQIEPGTYPTSRITATTAAATRNAFHRDITLALEPPFRVKAGFRLPDRDLDTDAYLFCLHDGSANNLAKVYIKSTGDVLRVGTTVGLTWEFSLTGDVADGSEHSCVIDFLPGRTVAVLDSGQRAVQVHGKSLPVLTGGKLGRSYSDSSFLGGYLVDFELLPIAA